MNLASLLKPAELLLLGRVLAALATTHPALLAEVKKAAAERGLKL